MYKQSTHSRNFYGRFDGEQALPNKLSVQYTGAYSFFDKGDLYKEYNYGVTRKSHEISSGVQMSYSVPLISRKVCKSLSLSTGIHGSFEKAFLWDFTLVNFKERPTLYKITPLLGVELQFKKGISLAAKAKRYIDRGGELSLDYWDIGLSIRVGE